jgi:hypothetical protein
LFDDPPRYAPSPRRICPVLPHGRCEGTAELTRPVVSGGTFVGAIERIYLWDGGDDDGALLPDHSSDAADGFEPQVARK